MPLYLHLPQRAIAWHVDGLHPDYEDIYGYFQALDQRYPVAQLQAVRLFARPGDDSMGYTIGRVVHLNAHWFTRPRWVLDGAVAHGARFHFPGVPDWHGGMREPEHVWAHEFAHVIETALANDMDFAQFKQEGFDQARRHPDFAATGYSQADEHEWWAESFAAIKCGLYAPQLSVVRDFIETML